MPDEFRMHLVEQDYDALTSTDHCVWRNVLSRNEWIMERYADRIHPAYVEGMRALELPRHVPRLEEINERIAPTGWRTVCVHGYIPTAAYVGMMSSSIFPVSRLIRRPEHIEYAPAPDMVHDILGHLPMLFSPEHREFLKRLATVMAQAVPNALDAELYSANRNMSLLRSDLSSSPADILRAEQEVVRVHEALLENASELTHLGRMYLWSVEFGLIGNADHPSIFGAALMSAPAEFRAVCEASTEFLPYSLDVIDSDIAFSDLQMRYFVARDFAHLQEVLAAYEVYMYMQRRGASGRASEIRGLLSERAERERRYA
jgi:phenylalanine-4-hydroxylase